MTMLERGVRRDRVDRRMTRDGHRMTSWNILVAFLEGFDAAAAAVRDRLSAAWPEGSAPNLIVSHADALDPKSPKTLGAAILVCGADASQSHTLPFLTVMEEEHVPVMALLDGTPEPGNPFEFVGAMVESASASGAVLRAIIQGLAHRQAEVNELRKEVALAQRFQGGLKGEIAKIHEELQLAALVQREFLPREIPSLLGMEFGALWRPTNYVSGDIYDVMRLDEDHIGVFIADAVGHGVPAALMTMVICRSLLTKEVKGNSYRLLPPSEVLAHLNLEMIRRQGRTTRFATAVYAVVNCRSRVVTLAGAGHPPPIHLTGDGQSMMLETPGGLLGVFGDEHYDQIELELSVGDHLLFYSDGFEQAFPTPQADPYQRRLPSHRYRDEFGLLASTKHPDEMIDAINRRIDDQRGSLHQIDDLTLVCIHAGPLVQAEPDDHAAGEPTADVAGKIRPASETPVPRTDEGGPATDRTDIAGKLKLA